MPRAIREISVFRASVLAKAIASMSIDIEIRNICRAALSCGTIGILPCCRGLHSLDWPIIPTRGGLRQDVCRKIVPTVLVSGDAAFIDSHTCKASLSASRFLVKAAQGTRVIRVSTRAENNVSTVSIVSAARSLGSRGDQTVLTWS